MQQDGVNISPIRTTSNAAPRVNGQGHTDASHINQGPHLVPASSGAESVSALLQNNDSLTAAQQVPTKHCSCHVVVAVCGVCVHRQTLHCHNGVAYRRR